LLEQLAIPKGTPESRLGKRAVASRPDGKVVVALAVTKEHPGMAHDPTPSELIDARITELGDWRGDALGQIRELIKKALPDVVEEWKWRGVPTWYDHGIICTGETYKDKVKLTFAKGASLDDPTGLFNSSLDGNVRRAVDFHSGDKVNARALSALLKAAAKLNRAK
jgi:hypothetical protein